MNYPKIPLAQSIIEICLSKGIHDIVISPGSRNAPLTIGFVANPAFNCYSIVDERCAAFFALGIAQQKQKPVALVCTSGSALLNYYPAFAEAFYSQIPLIIISADRPKNKIDIGDGQTIRQENVFVNHSAYNANLTENATNENDLQINHAIDTAINQQGPVHINAPFEEPLYETVSSMSVKPKILENEILENEILENETNFFVENWNQAKKKLVLIGVNQPQTVKNEILNYFANDDSVIVMTETTSNIHHPTFINNIDTIITPFSETEFIKFRPEILLSFGGMIVSKRIKSFLRKYTPNQHWHIDPFRAYNTFGVEAKHFKTTVNQLFNKVLPSLKKVETNYCSEMNKVIQLRELKTKMYLDKIPFSDFKSLAQVIAALPLGSNLQVSNSSAIRYAQLIAIDPSIVVFCNRGTSGIDGSTATAIGTSVTTNKPTTLITGDISFLYDSNALWNNYIPSNFRIVIMNNQGGGIFRILPGHQEKPVFNTFFETQHRHTAKQLAAMYDFEYEFSTNESDLENSLVHFFKPSKKPKILEIFTPIEENNKILLQFFNELT
jgi:2-succinyl-5-enolpyruvyl-6-hydroxy-3-cyclohexene-1-carboxylate synthase